MSQELSNMYRSLFDSLKEGSQVEIVCNTSDHLARVRAALKNLKRNHDETYAAFADLFSEPNPCAGKKISIKKKQGEEFVYIISLEEVIKTNFTILNISSSHNNSSGNSNGQQTTIPT